MTNAYRGPLATHAEACFQFPESPFEIRPSDEELARLTRALSHPARVAILRYLVQSGECACTGLTRALPLNRPDLGDQIRVLKQLGLVVPVRVGRVIMYSVNLSALGRIKALIGEL